MTELLLNINYVPRYIPVRVDIGSTKRQTEYCWPW